MASLSKIALTVRSCCSRNGCSGHRSSLSHYYPTIILVSRRRCLSFSSPSSSVGVYYFHTGKVTSGSDVTFSNVGDNLSFSSNTRNERRFHSLAVARNDTRREMGVSLRKRGCFNPKRFFGTNGDGVTETNKNNGDSRKPTECNAASSSSSSSSSVILSDPKVQSSGIAVTKSNGGTDTTTPTDQRPSNAAFIAEHTVDPTRAVFPWRHSSEPLMRLIPNTIEYKEEGGKLGPNVPFVPKIVASFLYGNALSSLNVPFWKILLLSRQWENELAVQFAWAFEQGVAGVLANTYHVPVDQIYPSSTSDDRSQEKEKEGEDDIEKQRPQENFDVNFDYTTPASDSSVPQSKDPTSSDKVEGKADKSTDKNSGVSKKITLKDDGKENDDNDDDDNNHPDVEYMLQNKLRTLYEAAREHGRGRLQIELQTSAVSAHIESIFIVPFLTRNQVEATPALRHSFRNIVRHLENRQRELGRRLGLFEIIAELADELEALARKQAGNANVLESTVVAQVSIQCRERFRVKDVASDQVIQGDPEGKVNNVVHLVRFEMVVKSKLEGGPSEIGSWQITDWDDLLGGNVFFL